MKRAILTLCLVIGLSFFFFEASAQAPQNSMAFRHTWYNTITPLGSDGFESNDIYQHLNGTGIEIAYYRRILNRSFFVVPGKLGVISTPSYDPRYSSDEAIANLDLLFQQHIFKYGSFIDPYLHMGVGSAYNFEQDEFGVNIPIGVGVNVRLFRNIYISAQSQHRFAANATEGWHHGLGLHVFFGGDEAPPEPSDRDNDGITDEFDACPDEAGPSTTGGCPDTDSDGIADKADECPDLAGLEEFNGCPDSDGDGIQDSEDDCPSVKGLEAFNGCPDTDNDGIKDSEDKCPREPGTEATGGCPDRDGDSVIDREDACPDKAGDVAHSGCPDTDGDGVYDNEDRCVTEAGPASNNGCPEEKVERVVRLEVDQVLFATAKSTILSESYPILDDIAKTLNDNPDYNLKVSGYTDNTGSESLNLRLSKLRAEACVDYLENKGIAEDRMSYQGYGEADPVADNDTEEGRAQNRRVEFDLIKKN